jgi:hypothetical protein
VSSVPACLPEAEAVTFNYLIIDLLALGHLAFGCRPESAAHSSFSAERLLICPDVAPVGRFQSPQGSCLPFRRRTIVPVSRVPVEPSMHGRGSLAYPLPPGPATLRWRWP